MKWCLFQCKLSEDQILIWPSTVGRIWMTAGPGRDILQIMICSSGVNSGKKTKVASDGLFVATDCSMSSSWTRSGDMISPCWVRLVKNFALLLLMMSKTSKWLEWSMKLAEDFTSRRKRQTLGNLHWIEEVQTVEELEILQSFGWLKCLSAPEMTRGMRRSRNRGICEVKYL